MCGVVVAQKASPVAEYLYIATKYDSARFAITTSKELFDYFQLSVRLTIHVVLPDTIHFIIVVFREIRMPS